MTNSSPDTSAAEVVAWQTLPEVKMARRSMAFLALELPESVHTHSMALIEKAFVAIADTSRAETAAAKLELDEARGWTKWVSDYVREQIPDGQNKDQADSPFAAIGLITRNRDRAEAAEAALAAANARAEALERDEPLDRPDDITAESIKFQCDQCALDEDEFCCHDLDQVVVVGRRVLCLEHAKDVPPSIRRKAPNVLQKLRRHRAAISAGIARAEAAEAKLAKVPAVIELLEFNAKHIIAEDDKTDALAMLEAMREVVIEAAGSLRALAEIEGKSK